MILTLKNYLVATVALLALPAITKSQESIDSWNKDNVVTEEGPRVPGETYSSFVFDDATTDSATSYGGIIWVESDVQAPGMKVVTDGDGDASCIMTAGFDPENPSEPKQCNDGFKTSKRFKRVSRDTSGSVDLVFDVGNLTSPPADSVYRIFEKYENLSPDSIDNFTVRLGTGIGTSFVAAEPSDGISFVKKDDDPLPTEVVDCNSQSNSLAAFFAFGLFGNATTNDNQDLDGYYDPTDRSCFKINAVSSTMISTDGLSGELSNIYGPSWMSKTQAPVGFFYDIDNKPSTDNLLVADWNGTAWVTRLSSDSPVFLELSRKNRMVDTECDYSSSGSPIKLSEATITKWISNPRLFNVGIIEDHGNVNLNYHIKVNSTFTTAGNTNFTLRITPTAGSIATPWLETLPWNSTVSVSFRDNVTAVAAESSSNVAVIVANDGPDEIVTGEFKLYVVNEDDTVGFRKTISFSKLKAGNQKVFNVACLFPAATGMITLKAEVEAFGSSGTSTGDETKIEIVAGVVSLQVEEMFEADTLEVAPKMKAGRTKRKKKNGRKRKNGKMKGMKKKKRKNGNKKNGRKRMNNRKRARKNGGN